MIEWFKKFCENNSDSITIGAFMFSIVILFICFSSCIDYSEKQKKIEQEEIKSTMTEDEKIKYDASQKFCTKRTGSRPSCWSDTDWDLFFIKYCERLPHQCE